MRIARTERLVGVASTILVLVCGALMQESTLRFGGVAPNLLIASLAVISFFSESFVLYGALTLLAGVLIRATPALFDPAAVGITIAAIGLYIVQRRMVWPGFIGTSILVVGSTVLLYLCIDPGFLWRQPGVLVAEVVYTAGVSLVMFASMRFVLGDMIRR